MNQLKNGTRSRALRLLAGMVALGAAATVMAAAPASATTWEDDLVVRESYVNVNTGEVVEARCRVDVSPIAAKDLPGYVTVKGKVRCNHKLLAGGGVAFYVGSHDGDAAFVVADLRRIRSGSSPDKSATFAERIYISPDAYRGAGGSGTWAVRGLELGVTVRTLDSSRLFLWGVANRTVETFRAY